MNSGPGNPFGGFAGEVRRLCGVASDALERARLEIARIAPSREDELKAVDPIRTAQEALLRAAEIAARFEYTAEP